MNFQDDPNDPDWKATKLKTESSVNSGKPKYSQKFCEKWVTIFAPWLSRCEDDPNKPFCRACQSRLDCNRCHLQRHERTSKHARNLEILINKGEGAARQNLSIRQERSKYYQQRKKSNSAVQEDSEMGMDEDDIEEVDHENDFNYEQHTDEQTSEDQYTQEDNSMGNTEIITTDVVDDMITTRSVTKNNNIGRPRKFIKNEEMINDMEAMSDRKEGMKLLMQIQKDKSELMDSFKEFMGGNMTSHQSPHKEKNHVDLFFESVSSSVKALSPKLIAETKMRVSQLICELELRALTENDNNQQHPPPNTTMVVSNEASSGSYVINQSIGHATTNIMQHQTHTTHLDDMRHYEALS